MRKCGACSVNVVTNSATSWEAFALALSQPQAKEAGTEWPLKSGRARLK